MTASVLITGGAGFIGQNLVHCMVENGSFGGIVVLDKLTYAGNPASLGHLIDNGRILFVHGDICDAELVKTLFDAHRFDTVAHLAAESHVDRSILGPDAFIETNVIGTYNLLKCALAAWQSWGTLDHARFLHVSTDEVFGDLAPDDAPFHEASPYRPSSPYSASKASSDHLVRAYNRTYGLPVVVTNCSNNFGPYQHPEKLIPFAITSALRGKTIPLYGDGLNVRDWLFVIDHCKGLMAALLRGKIGATYGLGGSSERTNRKVLETLCDILDTQLRKTGLAKRFPDSFAANGRMTAEAITLVNDRAGHDRRYAIDASLARTELGFVPAQSFEAGLERTVDWYIENETWWRRALSGDFQDWVQRNYGKSAL
jgi:dTDP-glucose 4,6-dehydratase